MRIEQFRTSWCHDIADDNIAWAIHVYRSKDQASWCLENLRANYPASRIVIINDGDGDSYLDIAKEWRCAYIDGDHLMTLETGHLYVSRLLTSLLDGPEQYLFKIDPDTKVWRRFRSLPAFTSVFGTIETVSESRREEIAVPCNVQGGCIGLTRDSAEAIVTSGLLTHENCCVRHKSTWARCAAMERVVSVGKVSDDFVVSWAAHQVGVVITESSEIRSRWRLTPPNDELRFAITHPHKILLVDGTV
jgi:hypothetical protein